MQVEQEREKTRIRDGMKQDRSEHRKAEQNMETTIRHGNRTGILIAGSGSGSGKTTFTCGLLRVLQRRGINPCAFKCGPDYIDPSFHRRVLGVPCYNLDPFFTDETMLRYLYGRHGITCDINVIEGVMGYYDGLGFTEEASTYALASALRVPVILMVDCKGMGNSIMAVVEGFLSHKRPSLIAGVIFNRLAPSLYERAARAAEFCGIRALGYLPETEAMALDSRHLGLVMAEEVKGFDTVIDRIAAMILQTVDVEGILEVAGVCEGADAAEVESKPNAARRDIPEQLCRIAVAQDEAFCFLYEDNLNFLRERGCEIVPFSPLHDSVLPACEALYLSGGYPELYAERLSANRSIRHDICDKIKGGLPCIAECGGFLYLHDRMEARDGGTFYPMAGVIKADALCKRRKGHFGYIEVTMTQDGLLGSKGDMFRAHEFHYWESTMKRADLNVLKPGSGAVWREGLCSETLYAGFPHLYFYGSPGVGERFVLAAREYSMKKKFL